MNELRKWNYERRDYEPHRIPAEWNVSLYETDMEQIVNCAHCGKELPWGKTYTSREIHDRLGFGYGVCECCYDEEWQRYMKLRED